MRTARPAGLEAALTVDRPDGFRLAIDLAIKPGRTVALLGPNGAGKSTTVQALSGLLALDDGEIVLDGRVLDRPADDVFVPPPHRRVGVVFQDDLLFEHLSVVDNVAFGPVSRGVNRRTAAARATELLDRLGLAGLATARPATLSGGQAQRVALARALAAEPALLLLDEPLSALDVTTRTRLRRTLADHLAGFEGPRLLITHDPTEAFLLAERILVIEGGRLTQAGTPDEIRRRPATPYVADLAGTNFATGRNEGGRIVLDDHDLVLHTADRASGAVQVSIAPRAVAVYPEPPVGSPRNCWPAEIEAVEPLGETTRLQLAGPLPLMADVTPGAVADLGLRPGQPVWVAVKATEVMITPLATEGGDVNPRSTPAEARSD